MPQVNNPEQLLPPTQGVDGSERLGARGAPGLLGSVTCWRVQQAATPADPDGRFVKLQQILWEALTRFYLPAATTGWD